MPGYSPLDDLLFYLDFVLETQGKDICVPENSVSSFILATFAVELGIDAGSSYYLELDDLTGSFQLQGTYMCSELAL